MPSRSRTSDGSRERGIGLRPSFVRVVEGCRLLNNFPVFERGEGQDLEDQTITGRVCLDDSSFVRCRFESAILVYTGQGAPPRIEACTFVGSRFEFEGPAKRTFSFLRALAQPASGLTEIVRNSFPALFGH